MKRIIALFLTTFVCSERGHCEDVPIELIRDGNVASRQAILSIHVRMESTQENMADKTKEVSYIEWWEANNKIKCIEEITSQGKESVRFETVCSGGEITTVQKRIAKDGTASESASFAHLKPQGTIHGDLWKISLFSLETSPRVSLADILQSPYAIKSAEMVSEDGQRFYRIKVACPAPREDRLITVEVDPLRNFLVKGFFPTSSSPKAVARFENRVVSFKEAAKGIYFPSVTETKTFVIDRAKKIEHLLSVTLTRFTLVEINEDVEDAVFDLSPKPGTVIADLRNKTTYQLGEDGNPQGEVLPLPEARGILANPTYSGILGISLSKLIVLLIAAIILSGAAVLWIRRSRKAHG